MAIAFVNASPVVNGANPTVAIPTGYAEGNLLVLVTTGTATPTTPTGWTQRYAQGAGRFVTILTRYASATEASVALTLAGTTSTAAMLCYSGAGSWDILATVATGTSTTATTNTQTTTYANDYVISIYATTNAAATLSTPTGTTSRVNSSGTTSVNGLLLVDELKAAAGLTTARASTLGASVAWAAISISFCPIRTLYWAGSAGTWNTTTVGDWGNSSGVVGANIKPPVEVEDVIIDSSSGTGTITCTGGVCNNLTVTATQAIILGAASSTLSVYGNLTFPSGGSFSASTNANTITLTGNTANTITSNGKTFSSLTIDGVGGTYTFVGTTTVNATATITNGTLDIGTNGVTFNCLAFASAGTGTRVIAFGSGNITTTGTGTVWSTGAAIGLSFTGTPTVNINNNTATAVTVTAPLNAQGAGSNNAFNFNFINGTYALTITTNSFVGSLNFTGFTGTWAPGTALIRLYGSLTLVAGMTFTTPTVAMTFAGTGTITSAGKTLFSITQLTGSAVTLASGTTTLSTTATYTLTGGSLDVGTNSSTLSTGLFTSSNSNTRSIAFGSAGAITLTGAGGTLWDTSTATNFTVTGTSTVNVPYAGATATSILSGSVTGATNESAAVSFNISAGTYTLTTNSSGFDNLNFTGFAGTWNPATTVYLFGNLTFSSGMTFTSTGSTITFATSSPNVSTITTAGKTFASIITSSSATGTIQFPSALTCTSFTHNAGTLDLATNISTLTCGTFNSSGSTSRSISFGTGNITVNSTAGGTVFSTSTATNLTVTGTPTVNISCSTATATTVTPSGTGGSSSNAFNFNFTTGTYTLTLTTGTYIRNLNFTGFTGSYTPGVGTTIFYGDITLSSGMTFPSGTGSWSLDPSAFSSMTLISAGKSFERFTVIGSSGQVIFGDNITGTTVSFNSTGATLNINTKTTSFTTVTNTAGNNFISQGTLNCTFFNHVAGTFTLSTGGNVTVTGASGFQFQQGTLDLGSGTVTCEFFYSSYSNTRTISFNTSGNITIIGSQSVAWNSQIASGLSYTGTPTVNISRNTATATQIANGSSGGGASTNAFNFNFTIGTYTLTMTSGSTFGALNFTGFTGAWNPATNTYNGYGSLTLVSGMTYSGGQYTFLSSGSMTITSAGKSITSIAQNSGTITLGDDLTVTNLLSHVAGTFDANNKNVTTNIFQSFGSNVRTLTMGSGLWTLTVGGGALWSLTSTNLTFNKGTANIVITAPTASGTLTFAGAGLTYNDLTLGTGTATGVNIKITGSNTFATLKSTKTVAWTLTLPSGGTTTCANWTITGTAGNVVTLNSSSAGSQATLTKTGGGVINTIDYLSIQDSNATPSSTWYAGNNSVNVSNNTGWVFPGALGTSNYFLMF